FVGENPKDHSPAERKGTIDEPYSAYVFKTIADPYSGKISMFRVYSGVLRSDNAVHNVAHHADERVGSLASMQGREMQPVPEVRAGDIGAVAKLKETATGDTLADKAHPIVYPKLVFPEPSIS